MGSLLADAAKAVEDLIDGLTLERQIVLEREYAPSRDVESLGDDLIVTVSPRSESESVSTRGGNQHDLVVDVGVQAAVDPADADAIDALSAIVEVIQQSLNRMTATLSGGDRAVWIGTNKTAFRVDHLRELRTFTSVLSVTLRVIR